MAARPGIPSRSFSAGPDRRTVSAALRVMGLGQTGHFQRYHRVLNCAVWSGSGASRVLLEADETALIYSDKLVEAHEPEGEMFGFPQLRALIAEHGEESWLGDFLLE
jgi:hypothetical protein